MLDTAVRCGQIDVVFFCDVDGWRLTTFATIDGELFPGGWISDPFEDREMLELWVDLISADHPDVNIRTWEITDGGLLTL